MLFVSLRNCEGSLPHSEGVVVPTFSDVGIVEFIASHSRFGVVSIQYLFQYLWTMRKLLKNKSGIRSGKQKEI
jgi:hypothetical protein